VVGESEKILFLEVGRYGCQNDGLDEADMMVREGGREGGTGGRSTQK
jgi:hypothetical protein